MNASAAEKAAEDRGECLEREPRPAVRWGPPCAEPGENGWRRVGAVQNPTVGSSRRRRDPQPRRGLSLRQP